MNSENKKVNNNFMFLPLLFPFYIIVFDLVLSTLGVEIGLWLAMSVFLAANSVVLIPLAYLTKFLMKKKENLRKNFFFDFALLAITFTGKIWFGIWMLSIVGVDSSREAVWLAFGATEALRIFGEPLIALIMHLIKGIRGRGIENKAS